MHLAVSWDITSGFDETEIREAALQVLRPYSWYRPLSTFYIIRANITDREHIIAGLTNVATRWPDRLRFVVTPVMQGPYQGILHNEDWNEINQRTA